ncbi:hypothetical protein BKA58DRAFT_458986 [Alternaria rosae]|uniref:uncharacterized protein n=1 Tax=Alternaria rosae TaxID=1187941 RepID=UPI001E8CB408|nr:uncharacterized protein BKA58DRAFT_458986 [Alternaria rosae]KAH6868290.1 hypothetical protein BKA58DRAFT_458986 [Alternaria rosae]
MLRKFSAKIAAHRSAESPKTSPQTSYQPSHYSTPARNPSIYGSRYSELTPPESPHTPRSFDRASHSATGTPRASDGTPCSTAHTPHSSSQPPRSLNETPRSSTSAPRPTVKHHLSPPPPNISYDEAAWAKHDYLLYSVSTRALNLHRTALDIEARWRAAEAATPPSKQYTIGRAAHIPTLVEVHQLLARINTLKREERRWRKDWHPRSPMLRYPAWGNVYGEAMGVSAGEGEAPWDVVQKLDATVEGLLDRLKEI